MPEALAMSPAQTQEFELQIRSGEQYVKTEVIPSIARRAALWIELKEETEGLITPEELVGADLVERNNAADAWAISMIDIYIGLESGENVFVQWQIVGERGTEAAGLGIMKRADVPEPTGMLGSPWGFIPVVLQYATKALLLLGGWLLVDSATSFFKNEGEARLLREETANIGARTVARVAETDPDKAAILAGAMVKSGRASIDAGADPLGWFQKKFQKYIKEPLSKVGVGGWAMVLLALLAAKTLSDIGFGIRRAYKKA